jgi:PAS domain S-box-containing protein
VTPPLFSHRRPFARRPMVPQPNIPLRVILSVPFVLLVSLAVGGLGYLSYHNGERLTQRLADQFTDATSDRIQADLSKVLFAPQLVARQNAAAIQQGKLNWRDPTVLEQYFWQQTKILATTPESVTGIGLTDEQKNFISMFRLPDGAWSLRLRNASTGFRLKTYRLNQNRDRVQLLQDSPFDPHYNPPQRPWYQAAKQAQTSTWQMLVATPMPRQPTVVLVNLEPFYDSQGGEFLGITSSSIQLSKISRMLQTSISDQTTQAFILDRQGFLVGTSTDDAVVEPSPRSRAARPNGAAQQDPNSLPTTLLEPNTYRVPAVKSLDSVTKATAQFLQEEFQGFAAIQTETLTSCEILGDRYFIRVTPLKAVEGFEWLSVVMIKETAFNAEIQQNNRNTWIACIAALAGTILLGLGAAELIAKPISRLNRASQDLMLGRLDEPISENSYITEIETLAHSFNQMTEQVFDSIDQVTIALQESREKFTTVFRNSPDPITVSTLDEGIMLEVNDSFIQTLGLDEKQILGRRATDIGLWLSSQDRLEMIRLLQKYGSLKNYEIPSVTIQGEKRYTLISAGIIELDGKRCLLSVGKDITDRKRLETELRQSQAKLSDVLTSSAAGISSFRLYADDHREYDYVSPANQQIFGDTAKQFMVDITTWRSRVHPDDQDKIFISTSQITQPTWETEYRYQHPNGKQRWIADRLTFRWDGLQECWVVTVVSLDISDRKQIEAALQHSEEQLRQSEERFRMAFVGAKVGMALLTPKGEFLQVNPALCNMLGYSEAELLQMTYPQLTHQRHHQADWDEDQKLLAGQTQSFELEKRYIHKDGHEIWGYLTVAIVRDPQGHPLYFVSQVLDITARKQAEAELQQSQEQFRAAFDTSQIGMSITSLEGNFLAVNDALCRMFGYSSVELQTMRFHDLTHADDIRQNLTYFDLALAGEIEHYTMEKRYLRKDCSLMWGILSTTLVRDLQGQPLYFVSQIQDITPQRKIREELRQEQELTQSLIQASPAFISVIDTNYRSIMMNETMLTALGYTHDEVVGQDVIELSIPPNARDQVRAAFQQMIEQRVALGGTNLILCKDGSRIMVEWRNVLVFDEQGNVKYFFGLGLPKE